MMNVCTLSKAVFVLDLARSVCGPFERIVRFEGRPCNTNEQATRRVVLVVRGWVNIARFSCFNRDQKAREDTFGYGEPTSAHGTLGSGLDPHNTRSCCPRASVGEKKGLMKCKASLVLNNHHGSWMMTGRETSRAKYSSSRTTRKALRGEEAPRQTSRIFYGTSMYVNLLRKTAHLERDRWRQESWKSPQLACFAMKVLGSDLDSKKSCSPIPAAIEGLQGIFAMFFPPARCNQA